MVEVTRKDNYTYDDCHSYAYEFRTNDLIVHFSQAGNRDLYFTCFPIEDKKINQLKINMYDDYLLYRIVEDLYKDITDLSRWEHPTSYMKEFQDKLFNGQYISWESDDYCSMYEADGQKRYNYLNIYKHENEFILEFVNNSNRGIFSISFNTDRSKYRMFVGAFTQFLFKLETVTEEYHQIDFDEYLVQKRLIKGSELNGNKKI